MQTCLGMQVNTRFHKKQPIKNNKHTWSETPKIGFLHRGPIMEKALIAIHIAIFFMFTT